MVGGWETGTGLWIAEIDGETVGACVIVGSAPEYVPSNRLSETYLYFLISDRTCAGMGVGSALVHAAADEARAAGSEVLRVDCWAGAPSLVDWYTRQGFTASDTFTVGENWRGQLLEMVL
jgi:GNAT superfamily N-acetyltransferase